MAKKKALFLKKFSQNEVNTIIHGDMYQTLDIIIQKHLKNLKKTQNISHEDEKTLRKSFDRLVSKEFNPTYLMY